MLFKFRLVLFDELCHNITIKTIGRKKKITMKKIFSLILCMLPFTAHAADSIIIESGSDGGTYDTGLTVNDMFIGQDAPSPAPEDNYYGEAGINQSKFTISTSGPVVINNTLNINTGYTLNLGIAANPVFDVTVGEINANGSLFVINADNFLVQAAGSSNGTIVAYQGLNIGANTMTSGAIEVWGGDVKLNIANALNFGAFTNKGTGDVDITAGTLTTAGDIENLAGGDFTVLLSGDMNVDGNVENSGTSMTIGRNQGATGIDITIDGTVKNESDSSMYIYGDSLTINGGSLAPDGSGVQNPSFANKGNLEIDITGQTYLEYGFDLSAMQQNNSFSLTTGTLVFGDDVDNDVWLQVFSNNLNSFYLEIKSGDIDASNIINNTGSNASANMEIAAVSVSADSVTNSGEKLSLKATGGTGINISGAVSGLSGSTTLAASTDLVVGGAISNNATMSLSGNQSVELFSVANTSGSLEILSSTNNGQITINNGLKNSGTVNINAMDITINGSVENTGGTMTITGSNGAETSDLVIGNLLVNSGTVNINALDGGVSIGNNLTVSDGVLNIDKTTTSFTVDQSVLVSGDFVLGNVALIDDGSINVAASGPQGFVIKSTNAGINILGNVSVSDANTARSATFDAANIKIGQNVSASGKGALTFGGNTGQTLTVGGDVSANNGGTINFVAGTSTVGSLTGNGKFVVSGESITATGTDGINITSGVLFDDTSATTATAGLITSGTDAFTLATENEKANINLAGGISVVAGKSLTIDSALGASIGGVVSNAGILDINATTSVNFDNAITNTGTLTIDGQNIALKDVINTNAVTITASGDVSLGDVTNSNNFTLSGAVVNAGLINANGGLLQINSADLTSASIAVNGGTANIDSGDITVNNNVSVTGDFVQGGTSGALNLTSANLSLDSNGGFNVSGAFNATGGSAEYDFAGAAVIGGDVDVSANTAVELAANNITAQNVINAGTLNLTGNRGLNLGVVTNTGSLTIDSGTGIATVDNFAMGSTGTVVLAGTGLTSGSAFSTGATLYQNYNDDLVAGDINVDSNVYTITAENFNVAGIIQNSGTMTVNSSDIDVGGTITAQNLNFVANPEGNWMNVNVLGTVSGGVGFNGLEMMTIGGDYIFNNGSSLNAAILPYAAGGGLNSTTRNYWATVSLNEDETLGVITNAADAEAMITVGGQFVSDVSGFGTASNGVGLKDGQIGIDLFDMVDQGTAIWLIHADEGVRELSDKIRNLHVNFCNADASMCFSYYDLTEGANTEEGLPAYLSLRDTDGDGIEDSIYVVFDPRFGGPVEVFKIQPIVGLAKQHTEGEYVSAGALDNLISGQMADHLFFNDTPIEAIRVIFENTNMEELANELYNRMEDYNTNRDGSVLANFSRLFQVRELEQIAGSIALNEHTNFRSFEDYMLNEFIWNRNRQLKKAWADVDFGMFSQDVSDGKRVYGNRFNVSGGFDWQESETLILGLTGRISNMSADNSDVVNLSYADKIMTGQVDVDVSDLNVAVGGYLLKILGEKARAYGNAFLDIHFLDVARNQTYTNPIDGFGTAFSLISEWGLMHDILNQYIVGNLYARFGYNTGFSVKEKSDGQDYMSLESDGYLVLTPGYTLTAQKRIYPSAWFQIRPYASIGIEYDVLGAPDSVKYKFAPAYSYTSYDIDIDPMWANIGGGIEMLSASGIQVGVDYRYQYNSAIQLHNIKVSGSYRF